MESSITGLGQFTDRFKTRLIEMAKNEKDNGVRGEAVTAAVELSRVGLLEEADTEIIMTLIFHPSKQIRDVVVGLFIENFNEECTERIQQVDDDDLNETWIQFKILAECIVKHYTDNSKSRKIAAYKDSQSSQVLSQSRKFI